MQIHKAYVSYAKFTIVSIVLTILTNFKMSIWSARCRQPHCIERSTKYQRAFNVIRGLRGAVGKGATLEGGKGLKAEGTNSALNIGPGPGIRASMGGAGVPPAPPT